MAYIGKIPAAAALTADDISDGIITNAKLAQNIISAETELAVAPATTDEILISDAGVLKRLDASLIGGGNLVHLQTQTAGSDVANITFTSTYLTSTYTTYFITGYVIFDNIAQLDLHIHPSIDNGSNYNLTCASNAEGRYADTSANGAQHEPSPFANNYIYVGTDAKKGSASDTMGMVCFSGYMWNSLDYSKVDVTSFNFVNNRNYENTHTMPGYCGGNVFNAGSIVNNFKIQCETGNIETGSKISLFGVKQS